jgi:ParB family chromosome partitioning protein
LKHNVAQALEGLLVPIETLIPLENNPRRGDIGAIMASYAEFGQVKPIVVRPNEDGTSTVIAGNHQLEAARRLGWSHIAAVGYEVDDSRAIAFALADNRTMELGHTEASALNEMLVEVADIYPELFEGLGWDEFEIAEMEEQVERKTWNDEQTSSYTTPVIQPIINAAAEMAGRAISALVSEDEDGELRINAPKDADHREIATQGSTVTQGGAATAPQAVVQYTIVFDNPQQQRRWYEFIKWLRNDPAVAGNTVAEKLIDFIDQHIEV